MSNDKTPAQAAEEEYPPRPFAKVPAHDLNRARRDAFIKGAEWQASQAPSTGLTVDSVMDLADEVFWIGDESDYKGRHYTAMRKFHVRLTALTDLLDQTPSHR